MIYLDSASMHPVLPCALEAFNNAPFGNPSSEHEVGQKARNAIEQAREKIARCINANPKEIYFTSGATESATLVMKSLYHAGYSVTASPFEHHAISENIPNYESEHRAYAQMFANNETGEIMNKPLDTSPFSYYVVDATSALGHTPVDVQKYKNQYTFGGAHKFGGVPGAGFLYARTGSPLIPMIKGGGQERGMRSGTENVPAICAMASALEWQVEHMDENTTHVATLRQMMFQMLSRIPEHKWNTPFGTPCVPHILNISFDGVDAHALALLLSKEGVMVSAGAACSNGLREPSHVIMAMYNDESRARSAIRISFSHENTADEIVEAGKKIEEAVKYLRSLT